MASLSIVNARLPDGASGVTVRAVGGTVVEIGGRPAPGDHIVDADGRLLLPALAEAHAHLDKAFLAESIPNPTGDLLGACIGMDEHRDRLTVADTEARAERAARLMLANGATAIRTHVDVVEGDAERAVAAVLAVRERLRHLVHIEVVALSGWPIIGAEGADQRARLRDAMAMGCDLVGGCPHLDVDPIAANEEFLAIAADLGVGVDLHTDETLDPRRFSLEDLADRVTATGFPHRVAASHALSLGMQPAAVQQRTAEKLAAAGISTIALPATNLFLQGREQQTAMPRGITAVAALHRAGALVAAGADNLQDPFNPMGRGDCLETASLMVIAAHLLPAQAFDAVSSSVRELMGLPPARAAVGATADFVLLPAASVREAIAFAPSNRVVIKAGTVVSGDRP